MNMFKIIFVLYTPKDTTNMRLSLRRPGRTKNLYWGIQVDSILVIKQATYNIYQHHVCHDACYIVTQFETFKCDRNKTTTII